MVVENNSDFTKERLLFTSQAVLIIKSLKPNKKFTKKKNENQESSKAFWKKKLKITQKTKTTTHQLGRTILSLWSLMSYKEPIHSPKKIKSAEKQACLRWMQISLAEDSHITNSQDKTSLMIWWQLCIHKLSAPNMHEGQEKYHVPCITYTYTKTKTFTAGRTSLKGKRKSSIK